MKINEIINNSYNCWNDISFFVFDTIESNEYEERLNHLSKIISFNHPFLKLIEPIKCQGKEHLKLYYDEIIQKGGKGLIIRKPKSYFRLGKISSLLKIQVMNF